MPTAPYAKLRANIGGAGNASGVLTGTGAVGQACQLSQDPAGGGSSFKYEITDYPEGFALPTGWTEDATSGVYSYSGLTPPPFNLPAYPLWGKLMFRLTVNNGDPGTSGLDKTQFVDTSTVVSTPDPSGNGFEDIAYGETKQWDGKRKWMGAYKRNLRRTAKQALPSYAAVPDGYTLQMVGGVPMWMPGTPTFTGDFGALFAGYSGLNVRGYRRGDLGLSGTTGTGKSAWAHQMGDAGAMAPTSGATNGVGTPTAGLNGHAGMACDGSTQSGAYTFSGSFAAPGTTNLSIWAIGRTLVAANGWMHGSGTAFGLNSAGLGGGNLQAWDNGGGMFTNTATATQWYRIRCTFYGSNEDLRIGAHVGSIGSPSGNVAFSTSWGWGSLFSGSSKLSTEELCFVLVEGPRATFLTAAADADAKAQTFWSSAIEI